ncbi:MAG: DUF5916 domain-containing protein [Bacteroidales bacterium]
MKKIIYPHSILLLISLLSTFGLTAQRKQLEAIKTTAPIIIDGLLTDEAWKEARIATDFVQHEPYNLAPESFKTEVRVLYNDQGLYIGATMFDPHPDSISMELRSRDEEGLADFFGLTIDPFCDGLNGVGFLVSARNVQTDMKFDQNSDSDESWDAVWKSKTTLNDQGWIAELMIPYSALRFVKKDVQTWRVNFWRSIQRYREYSVWNPIDIKIEGELLQSGELIGLRDIQPPLRLSATPYISTTGSYLTQEKQWGGSYNYGLDLKAGLSESFTLDFTLIPDFGQVESDKTVYSLSPFEVYYDEKRPFFTEGTELFSKGEVFYSRRVGAEPGKHDEIADSYNASEIVENPETAQLINAAKISGKTNSGLGIGIFNAMNANTYAIVKDSAGNKQKILTEPFTNFNMFVVDQAFKNNSFLSFYNTNVYKPENKYSANVTGSEFRVRDRKNLYEIAGTLNISQHYTKDNAPAFGQKAALNIGKVSGIFQADTWLSVVTKDYNPNDMGFQQRTNEIDNGITFKHNIFEPRGNIIKWYTAFSIEALYRLDPRKFTLLMLEAETRGTFKNQLTIGGESGLDPMGYLDFYEPRVDGRYYHEPGGFKLHGWYSPDYSKTFMIDDNIGIWYSPKAKQFSVWGGIAPRWRLNEAALLVASIQLENHNNGFGYVNDTLNPVSVQQDIIFGRRDVNILTTSLSLNYSFNSDMSVFLKARHYWLRVAYLEFYDLLANGELKSNSYNESHDFTVNAFNVDMVFQWNFAPGSELLVIWKNALYQEMDGSADGINYFENFDRMFDSPLHNSLSIKALYYLDWQYFQKIKKNKSQVQRPGGI